MRVWGRIYQFSTSFSDRKVTFSPKVSLTGEEPQAKVISSRVSLCSEQNFLLGGKMNSPLTSEMLVNSFVIGNQNAPRVATLADGYYYVVWTSQGQEGDQAGIFAQHFSAQSARIGAPVQVNSTASEIQRDASIAATEDGGFVFVWEANFQDNPGSGDFGVIGQRFAAD